MNPLARCRTVPGTFRNTILENQESSKTRSQDHPHPEVEPSVYQSRHLNDLDPDEAPDIARPEYLPGFGISAKLVTLESLIEIDTNMNTCLSDVDCFVFWLQKHCCVAERTRVSDAWFTIRKISCYGQIEPEKTYLKIVPIQTYIQKNYEHI